MHFKIETIYYSSKYLAFDFLSVKIFDLLGKQTKNVTYLSCLAYDLI